MSTGVFFGKRRARAVVVVTKLVATGLVATVLVASVTIGGVGALGAPRVATAAPAPALQWGSCHNSSLDSDFQCATLQVPIDGEELGDAGPTFGLALARHQASGHKIGSLLINPGGPGESGVNELAGLLGGLSDDLVSHFDVIGFDPPGVGASDPVTCLDPAEYARYLNLDPAPTTAAGIKALETGNRDLAQGCEAHSRAILPHVSTVAAARDMDRIRQAVGDSQLSYLGFSYGTLLGATYAGLYPKKVRAMALDGALDPAIAPVPMIATQAEAIDDQFRQLEASCAAHSCSWRAPKAVHAAGVKAVSGAAALAAAFQALLARVTAHPLAVSGTAQTVGPAQLLYGTADGLYSSSSWPDLEKALAAATSGNGSKILAMYDEYFGYDAQSKTFSNISEVEPAVNCLGATAPTVSQLEVAARALAPKAPVFGLLDMYSELTCSLWPVPPVTKAAPIHADGSPPIVVVGSTGDPVTPYSWAVNLAHELQHGVLLTRVGDGHTAYFSSACVDKALDAYLVDLKAPPAGERCASN